MATSRVLIDLPLGKFVDPHSPEKGRCLQKGSEGSNASLYYGFIYSGRERIGKDHPVGLESQRSVEWIASRWRKAIKENQESFNSKCNFLPSTFRKAFQIMDLKPLFEMRHLRGQQVPFQQASYQLIDSQGLSIEEKQVIKKALEAFWKVSKYEQLNSFLQQIYGPQYALLEKLKYQKQELQLNTNLLVDFGVICEEEFEKDKKKGGIIVQCMRTEWRTMTLENKIAYSNNVIYRTLAKKYGFQETAWTPSDSIENLIECLETKGQLCSMGNFPHVGTEIPTEREDLKSFFNTERPFFSWEDVDVSSAGQHAVTIVGAVKTKENDGFVIYVNSSDSSDPQDPGSQPYNVISFERFKDCVVDVHYNFEYFFPEREDKQLLGRASSLQSATTFLLAGPSGNWKPYLQKA